MLFVNDEVKLVELQYTAPPSSLAVFPEKVQLLITASPLQCIAPPELSDILPEKTQLVIFEDVPDRRFKAPPFPYVKFSLKTELEIFNQDSIGGISGGYAHISLP